jgi:hypothetical protein
LETSDKILQEQTGATDMEDKIFSGSLLEGWKEDKVSTQWSNSFYGTESFLRS